MITVEKLMGLNKKQIETILNSFLKDFTKTSIEQSEVKEAMFNHLKKQLVGIKSKNIDYHYNGFYLIFNNIRIEVKTSVKSTNEIIKVTKLRSKTIKGKGAFKISDIIHSITHYSYEFKNEKDWIIKIKKDCVSSGTPSQIYLTEFNLPLKDMCTVAFLLKADEIQGKASEKYNNNVPYEGFINSLKNSVAQPVIKKLFFKINMGKNGIKKSQLKDFPEPYFSQLPQVISNDEFFNLIRKTVAEINSELITDIVNNKTFIIHDWDK